MAATRPSPPANMQPQINRESEKKREWMVLGFGWDSILMSLWVVVRFETGILKSLFENSKGSCEEGFWWWPRRRGRRIPGAGCNGRANAGHRQKTRRPEGF